MQSDQVLGVLKRVAALLRDAGIPFALGGGLAAWARGGPPSEKDVDLLVREQDCDRARDVLAEAGYRTEVPPEGWLVKAFDGDVLIDLIHRPSGLVVDDDLLDACDELSVNAVRMPVMRIDDLLTSKLLSLTEHHLDFGPALEISRALREQIDWESVRQRTDASPFARAFFALIRELGIVEVLDVVANVDDDARQRPADGNDQPGPVIAPVSLVHERAS
ncbi:MAG: nucleotidyltransferase [Acidimicrobiaceae bacterium]|nr:nucleotidyltransferase [Acidimicrobiaceae bacterium]